MSSPLKIALDRASGAKKPYRMASQAILDTPKPTPVMVRKTTPKAGYKIPKEPSNGRGVGY